MDFRPFESNICPAMRGVITMTPECSVPTINDIESVLNFVTSVMNGNEWKTLKHLLQTQYKIDKGFTMLSSFRRTLLFLKDTLPDFCEKTVKV
jgi:hypothetical protein